MASSYFSDMSQYQGGLSSGLFSLKSEPPMGQLSGRARQIHDVIAELERSKNRFENEQESSVQFGRQMGILAKQIESLTEQQQSMLGYHVSRIDSLIQDMKRVVPMMHQSERPPSSSSSSGKHNRPSSHSFSSGSGAMPDFQG